MIVRKARELTSTEALQDKLFVPSYMHDQHLAGGLGPAVKFFAALIRAAESLQSGMQVNFVKSKIFVVHSSLAESTVRDALAKEFGEGSEPAARAYQRHALRSTSAWCEICRLKPNRSANSSAPIGVPP